MDKNLLILLVMILVFIFSIFEGCENIKDRKDSISDDAIKITPDMDVFPPIIHSDKWENPIPMPSIINTAGLEDSPFITPTGDMFFFFFTPDIKIPVEKQMGDGVTGIWYSQKRNSQWMEPERVILSKSISLDGCPFIQGDKLWFCSIRPGNYGEIDVYTAIYKNGNWVNIENAGEQLNKEYDIGEFHISNDATTIYFGWDNSTGFGGRDIWKSENINGTWSIPINLGANINSELNEDQPFLTSDRNELWFTGQSRLGYPGPAIFRSIKMENGEWGKCEEIISNFAGEPTLDDQGNIYFVHHFFSEDMKMIEADIYVAYIKR